VKSRENRGCDDLGTYFSNKVKFNRIWYQLTVIILID